MAGKGVGWGEGVTRSQQAAGGRAAGNPNLTPPPHTHQLGIRGGPPPTQEPGEEVLEDFASQESVCVGHASRWAVVKVALCTARL